MYNLNPLGKKIKEQLLDLDQIIENRWETNSEGQMEAWIVLADESTLMIIKHITSKGFAKKIQYQVEHIASREHYDCTGEIILNRIATPKYSIHQQEKADSDLRGIIKTILYQNRTCIL